MNSLRQLAAQESALVATVKAATAAVKEIGTGRLDDAIAELGTALRDAQQRLAGSMDDLSFMLGGVSDAFEGEVITMSADLAAFHAERLPTPPVALPAPQTSDQPKDATPVVPEPTPVLTPPSVPEDQPVAPVNRIASLIESEDVRTQDAEEVAAVATVPEPSPNGSGKPKRRRR